MRLPDTAVAVAQVSALAAGLTTIATIKTRGKDYLAFQFDVAAQALDDFDVLGKVHSAAQLLDFTLDWTVDPPGGHRIEEYTSTGASENLAVTPAGGNGYFKMRVTGLDEVQVKVSAAVDGALITGRYSLS